MGCEDLLAGRLGPGRRFPFGPKHRLVEPEDDLTTGLHLGSALAHLGRMDEARAAAASGLALDPTFDLASFRAAQITDDPYYLAWRERAIDGMRMAGVPEG